MKITFVLPYAGLSGGIRVVATYAERLKKRGHEVFVVSLPKQPLTLRQKVKSLLKDKKWPSAKHGPSHFDGVDVEHRILEKCRPVINNDVPDADVIVATWWETAEWVASLSKSKGEKFYFIQGYEVYDGQPKERVRATYSLPLHKITISNWLLRIMDKKYSDTDVFLVPNSVDREIFNAQERSRQPVPTIGFMYSASHSKGCDIIIEALNRVREDIPELKIVAFGSPKPFFNLPLPPATKYFYQPEQEKIREIYSRCDFWLFGSRSEGFGLPILEAMACRTPVIATPVGAAPELLSNGGGILLNDHSIESMVKITLTVNAMRDSEWEAMSNQAYEEAKKYSWDDATDLFEKALNKTVDRKK
jgi:glycosyltransferase involved in cell wall biosynthesis